MSRVDSSYSFLSASIEDNASNLINITFLGDISLNTSSVSDYTVLVNNSSATLSNPTVSGAVLSLTLDNNVKSWEDISFVYDSSNEVLLDTSDNKIPSVPETAVTNNVSVPTVSASTVDDGTANTINITFGENVFGDLSKNEFSVTSDNNGISISGISRSDAIVTLTLSTKLLAGSTTTVNYSGSSITDNNSNPVATFTNLAVTNNISVPEPSSGSISDATAHTINLVFPESLNGTVGASDFDVSLNTASAIVNSVNVSGTNVDITLGEKVLAGQTNIVVKYTGTTLLDSASNQLLPFTFNSVQNNVSVPGVLHAIVVHDPSNQIVIEYNDHIKSNTGVDLCGNNYSVTVDAVSTSVTNAVFNEPLKQITLTIAENVKGKNQTVLVSFTSNLPELFDMCDNLLLNFTDQAVTNNIIDTLSTVTIDDLSGLTDGSSTFHKRVAWNEQVTAFNSNDIQMNFNYNFINNNNNNTNSDSSGTDVGSLTLGESNGNFKQLVVSDTADNSITMNIIKKHGLVTNINNTLSTVQTGGANFASKLSTFNGSNNYSEVKKFIKAFTQDPDKYKSSSTYTVPSEDLIDLNGATGAKAKLDGKNLIVKMANSDAFSGYATKPSNTIDYRVLRLDADVVSPDSGYYVPLADLDDYIWFDLTGSNQKKDSIYVTVNETDIDKIDVYQFDPSGNVDISNTYSEDDEFVIPNSTTNIAFRFIAGSIVAGGNNFVEQSSALVPDTNAKTMEITFSTDVSSSDLSQLHGNFTVDSGGNNVVTAANISNNVVTLTLTNRVLDGETVIVNYNTGSGDLTDIDGDYTITNFSFPDVSNNVIAPTFNSADIGDDFSNRINVVFDDSVKMNNDICGNDFVVVVNAATRNVTSTNVSSGYLYLTLESRVEQGDAVTLAYNRSESELSQNVTDTNDNPVLTFPAQNVSNNVNNLQYSSSSVATATNKNIVITFDYGDVSNFNNSDGFLVDVTRNGSTTRKTVESISSNDATATLTMTEKLVEGDVIDISYTKGANTITDQYSNMLFSFDQTVSNGIVSPGVTAVDMVDTNAKQISVTFDANMASLGANAKDDFSVAIDGSAVNISSIAYDSSTVLLVNIDTRVIQGDTVTLNYTDNDKVLDQYSNALKSFSGQLVDITNIVHPTVYGTPTVLDTNSKQIRVSFSENMNQVDLTAAKTDLSINIVGKTPVTVDDLSFVSSTLLLVDIDTRVVEGDTVSFTYTANNERDNVITDANSNCLKTISSPVSIDITNVVPPILDTVSVPSVVDATSNKITLVFTETIKANANVNTTDFDVSVDGVASANAVTGVTITGSDSNVVLTLTDRILSTDTVQVKYTQHTDATRNLTDPYDNGVKTFDYTNVANTVANLEYSVSSISDASPTNITITFTGGNVDNFDNSAGFVVDVSRNGSSSVKNVSSVSKSTNTATLTMVEQLLEDDEVTVSYTKDSNTITDQYNNVLFSLSNRSVNNNINATHILSGNIYETTPTTLMVDFDQDTACVDPCGNDYTVTANGNQIAVTNVVIDADEEGAVLTLAHKPLIGDTITVGYTKSGISNRQVKDLNGNPMKNQSDISVTNNITDLADYTSASVVDATPNKITIVFDETVLINTPNTNVFDVSNGTTAVNVTEIAVSGQNITLTLAENITETHSTNVRVKYTKVASSTNDHVNNITDQYGNEINSFGFQAVTNTSVDNTFYANSSVINDNTPNKIVMSFSKTLTNITDANVNGDFAVLADGVANAVTGVSNSGQNITLTLTNNIVEGQTVTVQYTNNASRITDTNTNVLFDIAQGSVTNNVDNPDYVSSVINDSSNTLIEITFDKTMDADNTTTAISDFSVDIVTVLSSDNSVVESETDLTILTSPTLVYGDGITSNGRNRADINNLTSGSFTYLTSGSTSHSSNGPFILKMSFPQSLDGKKLYKIEMKVSPNTEGQNKYIKFGYLKGSDNTVNVLNVTDVSYTGATMVSGTFNTGTVTWGGTDTSSSRNKDAYDVNTLNDSEWHVVDAMSDNRSSSTNTSFFITSTFNNDYTIDSTNDFILIRMYSSSNNAHFPMFYVKAVGATMGAPPLPATMTNGDLTFDNGDGTITDNDGLFVSDSANVSFTTVDSRTVINADKIDLNLNNMFSGTGIKALSFWHKTHKNATFNGSNHYYPQLWNYNSNAVYYAIDWNLSAGQGQYYKAGAGTGTSKWYINAKDSTFNSTPINNNETYCGFAIGDQTWYHHYIEFSSPISTNANDALRLFAGWGGDESRINEGSLDDLKIFDTALSITDIEALFDDTGSSSVSSETITPVTITNLSINGTKVLLNLGTTITDQDTVKFSYTNSNNVSDDINNSLLDMSQTTITNSVTNPDYANDAAVGDASPTNITMSFNENLTIVDANALKTDFVVSCDGYSKTISSVSVSDANLTIVMVDNILEGVDVTFTYTNNSKLTDSYGNDVLAISSQSVTNTVNQPSASDNAVVDETNSLLISLSVDQALSNLSASGFTVGGTTNNVSVSSVAYNSGTGKLELTLDKRVLDKDTAVTLSYNNTSGTITDANSNKLLIFNNYTVTNNVVAPVKSTIVINDGSPDLIVIPFSESMQVNNSSTGFAVYVEGNLRTISSVAAETTNVKLNLASGVSDSEIVTVSYTKSGAQNTRDIRDANNNPAESWSAVFVDNNINSAGAPTFSSAVVENDSANRIDITFSENLQTGTLTASEFSITVTGTASDATISSAAIVNKMVDGVTQPGNVIQLTLSRDMGDGDIITLDYNGTSLGDAVGTAMAVFTGQSVTNNVDALVPTPITALIEDANKNAINISFNERVKFRTTASASNFSISNFSGTITNLEITGDDKNLKLTLSKNLVSSMTYTVAYTRGNNANDLVDVLGSNQSPVENFNIAVINNVYPIPFVFELESMSVDVSYNEKPTYFKHIMDKALTGDATIDLTMSINDICGVFMFNTDSSNIDDICSNDITYTTNSSLWNSDVALDMFGNTDASGGSPNSTCINGENTPFSTHMNGAGEFVRHLASEITGGHGSSDIFANEVELLQAVKDLSGLVHTLIKQKIDVAGGVGGVGYRTLDDSFDNSSNSIGGGEVSGNALDASGGGTITNNQTIIGHTLLSQLLTGGSNPSNDVQHNNVDADASIADGRARVYGRLSGRDQELNVYGDSGYPTSAMSIPIEVGDKIKFNVVVRSNGQNEAGNDWHGLGINTVKERRYLVILTIQ